MELRSVEELMDLLHAARGARSDPDRPGSPRGPAGSDSPIDPGSPGSPNSPVRPGRPNRPGDTIDLHDHALQTAALLRRGHPSDKELQVAGLVHDIGLLLAPGDRTGHADRAASAVRPLLGERVSRLVRLHAGGWQGDPLADDVLTLRQASEAGRAAALDAGVMEDWRTLLELVAAQNSRLGAVD
ncbi:HD domain-containing protein [Streptomyces cavernae]|uniref:HD domain-containing protein n=1 Tax=Streptomyces cavernae TaxID=2259034 RepID=UPI000FEBF3D4|nr:HD domain-containing protein [Streptomyces cavernae]